MTRIPLALILINSVLCMTLLADDSAVSGRRVLPKEQVGYANSFALIIGINYEDRYGPDADNRDKLALPPLRNAESDAQAICDLLTQHYGYQAANVRSLIGAQATDDAINHEIGQLINPQRIGADDSVLLFFAGHGFQLIDEQRDRAAIFPYDVELSGGNPIDNYVRLFSDLFLKLKKSPARHKLVILDSCYSGEILKSEFYSAGERDDRDSSLLFTMPAFQAIASCRAYEVSSDGSSGINSPFTTALKKGLETLPARPDFPFESGLAVSRLFAYLHPELKGQSDNQEPQFGILEGDGEFRFFPSQTSRNHFVSQIPSLDEQKLLQAAVTSSEGNWWFSERPWFIPSLRKEILEKLTRSRSAEAELVGNDRLFDLAEAVVADGLKPSDVETREAGNVTTAANKPDHQTLQLLRYQHAKKLLTATGTSSFKDTLREIARELDERQSIGDLEAIDLHLLANLRHALDDREKADAVYRLALDKYRGVRAANDPELESPSSEETSNVNAPSATSGLPPGDSDKGFEFEKGQRALCLADYAEYLMQIGSTREAAKRFREADMVFGQEAPAAFRIFVLCREAGAWLQENRWANADERLHDAQFLAERFNSSHHLRAFVYRSLAWARMIQWRIEDAEYWFIRSNQVLNNSFAGAVSGDSQPSALLSVETSKQPVAADQPPRLDQPTTGLLPDEGAPSREISPFQVSREFREWDNVDARIMFLHNLHGLVMVQRFQGRTRLAAQEYRWLAHEVNKALANVTQKTTDAESDAEENLYSRLLNTLERLADCNLFGDPKERDLAEAIDDYRRALSRCHRVANSETIRTQLLYKQALALALPPDRPETRTQDLSLAMAACQTADEIYHKTYTSGDNTAARQADDRPTANGMILALGELTTKVVTLIATSQTNSSTDTAKSQQAAAGLRQQLNEFRVQHGPNLHRDQLEICLFATKVLLNHGDAQDRFHFQEDCELLLDFCRTALGPERGNTQHATERGETRAYLRPYYDTVMRSRFRMSDGEATNVKDMLEVQFEATRGHEYLKWEEARPVLAFYVLDDKCHLLMDLPWGASRCYSLSDDYDLDEIRSATTNWKDDSDHQKLLPLPREVQKCLAQWRDTRVKDQEMIDLVCYWEDLVPRSNLARWEQREDEVHEVARPVIAFFPFDLPAGFTIYRQAGTGSN